MKVICYIIAIALVLYFTDKIICYVYCKLKLKQSEGNNNWTSENCENKKPEERKNIIWKIKQLLYGWIMYSIVRLGKFPFQKYRIFILKHIYQMKIGKNVVIYGNFKIRAPWNIIIGTGTVVGDGAQLDGRNGIVIGNNVNISTDVYIYTEQHDVNDENFSSGNSGGTVVVSDRAWLSSRTTVLPKVTIGEGAVLASGALAAKNLEPFSINVGIPARKIGERNTKVNYEFDGSYIPFY